MPRVEPRPLRARLRDVADAGLRGAHAHASWREIARETLLGEEPFEGRSVFLLTRDPFAAARALVDLDGVSARIVIAPPDFTMEQLPAVVAAAKIDTMVCDFEMPVLPDGVALVRLAGETRSYVPAPSRPTAGPTEWVLFTSGTTGAPKMAVHDLTGLTAAIPEGATPDVVWGTFYDIRRYGGLQILLRAAQGGAALIFADPGEAAGDFLARAAGVTHLTGTPSHWRRALMSPMLEKISPRYIRLSGEIADQAILDALARAFPHATIGHAYASTEAGVGFEVTDGREGFPASFLGCAPVEMKVVDGVLRIRSPRAAHRFIGLEGMVDADGFIDTGDMVERREDRYYFTGRSNGIINVGGLKIHPEEVEAVINRQASVRVSRVHARRNPVIGAIVVADVVLAADADRETAQVAILEACRAALAPAKVPAALRFVESLELTAGGKLERAHA